MINKLFFLLQPCAFNIIVSIKNIHAVISGNKLIRKIAIVSFFSFLIFLIVNFVFYGYVKSEFKSDKDLVSFFAIFFGITRLITFALKIGIANKMVDKMGLRNALMLSPILLLLICGIGIYLIQLQKHHAIFNDNERVSCSFACKSRLDDV